MDDLGEIASLFGEGVGRVGDEIQKDAIWYINTLIDNMKNEIYLYPHFLPTYIQKNLDATTKFDKHQIFTFIATCKV